MHSIDPHSVLKKYFHYNSFRDGQLEVIQSVLAGRDTLGVMPTGSGKSLCYQLPALILPGVTLVISPLIALMKDQVDALTELNIPATFINSTLKADELEQRLYEVKQGRHRLLYIAPERFNVASFMRLINKLDVSFIAVDEAHCISQWGHDFRPSYLKISQIAHQIGRPPIVALTATATRHVQQDILKQLDLHEPAIVVKGFDRPNLKLFAVELNGEKEKSQELIRIVSSVKGSGIVYVATQKMVTHVCELLQSSRINCVGYHGGMDKHERNNAQNKWLSGKAPIIVATNAFGMGIDKADVRLVLHYNIPGSVEAYYQEAGRAGRDGKISYCVLFFGYQDHIILKFLIEMSFPPEDVLYVIYQFLFSLQKKQILMTYDEIAKQIDVKEMQVASAVKLFERYGILKRMRRQAHIFKAALTVGKRKAQKLVGSAPLQKKVLDYLTNDLSGKYDLEKMLQETGLSTAQFNRTVKAMEEKGVITYFPPFRGRGIEITSRQTSWNKVPIDFKEYRRQQDIQLKRLEEIEQYVTGKICRRKYILDYFGEKYPKKNCGACDVCLNWKSPLAEESEPLKKDDMWALLNAVMEFDDTFGVSRFAKLLKGEEAPQPDYWGVAESPAFGALAHKAINNIYRQIYAAIKKGYLNRTQGKYPKLEITGKGIKYLMERVK